MNDCDRSQPRTILLVDDNADDRFLTLEALKKTNYDLDVRMVSDCSQLMEYLTRAFDSDSNQDNSCEFPQPLMVFIDWHMPGKNGGCGIEEIKKNPKWAHLPVVVLTSSTDQHDVRQCYKVGGSSFIIKPISFLLFVERIKAAMHYWMDVAELPHLEEHSALL